MYNLNGKVALVTGAGGKAGLGRAIALRLAAEGADVVVNDIVPNRTGSPDWTGLPDVVREIEGLGRQALAVVADVSQSTQVEQMVGQALERFGKIDILVNNAGALAGRDRVPVVELEEVEWDRIQNVNVKGTFLCCRAAAKAMIAAGQGGKIINMSSVSGKKGTARFAAYCASKFAVRGFTQALALELAPHRINVNAICPGLIETERVAEMAAALAPAGVSADEQRQLMVARAGETVPLGRIGQARDVAQMAAFLASSESDYLTGLSMTVAGGTYMD
ncbi:MAG: glucose 1-dehydrogenase [Caldilineaceae bacterium]|nr:glucose 1-dehydrogenase [Caldilineaceae bacterium]HRJ40292.1 glucose 1-dehydrogenase [Caldilineaceae bacterium]